MIKTIILIKNKFVSRIKVIPRKVHRALLKVLTVLSLKKTKYTFKDISDTLWDIQLDKMPRSIFGVEQRLGFHPFRSVSFLYLANDCSYHKIDGTENTYTDTKLSDQFVRNQYINNKDRLNIVSRITNFINYHIKKCKKLHQKLIKKERKALGKGVKYV